MNRSLFFRILFVCLLLFIGLSVAQAQSDNLLTNPGFESPYDPIAAGSTSMVAHGWTAWYLETGSNLAPEYYAATDVTNSLLKPHIHSGSDAQQFFTFFAPHIAGVYQSVSGITAGTDLTFSVYAYVWVSSGSNPDTSDGSGALTIQVGIDPNGGTDPTSEAIVWSAAAPYYDQYDQYSVTAAAQGNTVTVFVRSSVTTVAMNNAVELDDASLTAGGAGVAPATEAVTSEATAGVVQPTEAAATPEATAATTEVAAVTQVVTQEATAVPPTNTPTEVPPTVVPPTNTPTEVPPTIVPPTNTPTEIPPTATAALTEALSAATEAAVSGSPTPSPTLDSTEFPFTIPYTVQRGDTVGDLATRFNSTVEAIIIVNQLSPDAFIYETQQILIPVHSLPTVTPVETEAPTVVAPTETPIVVQPVQTQAATPSPMTQEMLVTQRYVVKYGDTLSTIARLFGVPMRELARVNGIVNPNLIYVGQVLHIPVAASPTPTAAPAQPPTSTHAAPPAEESMSKSHHYYTVRPGDNLYRISILFNVPIGALMQANRIYDANYIFVGEILVIP